ncbi:MAG: hypothetical protein N2035_00345 [Chthoniobacterales bacterium]|nr:hypothetical protein [Chthoniobacterales bacterium]
MSLTSYFCEGNKSFFVYIYIFLLVGAVPVLAGEEQEHGLIFEKWIRDTFFQGKKVGYTDKWDIPGEWNHERGGYPVNPKAIRWGREVDMGDALRQYDINEPFWLVIGYWEQRGEEKWMVSIFYRLITPEIWRSLWRPVKREDLELLDALVKDRSLSTEEVRKRAHAMKKESPFRDSAIRLHPKIDEKGQRRLQCGLPFDVVFLRLGSGQFPKKTDRPELWGMTFPNPIPSLPRGKKRQIREGT